jgi:serine protease Do
MVARGGKEIELPTSSGTCFIVSPDGYALTNRHVVRSVQELSRATRTLRELETELKLETTPLPGLFAFLNGKISKVDIIFVSDDFDMAVLKLDRKCEDYFALSDQPSLERASRVIALGFPGAANHPLSTDEEVETQKRELLAIREGRPLEDWFKPRDFEYTLTRGDVNRISIEDGGRAWIQHSAIIAPGNSGGPLTLADGTVVGINTSVTRDGQSGQNYYHALSTAQLQSELTHRVPGLVWRNPFSSRPPKSAK